MSKYEFSKLLSTELLQENLIREALTHRSANAKKNNERLEFLGDAVLGSIIAEILYLEKPGLSEGGLTRMRSHLVRRSTLAAVANEINLAQYLIVGKGEAKSGGSKKVSLLADAFEAVVAALHILRGRAYVKKFIFKVFGTRLNDLPAIEAIKDPKSKLQELLQARKMSLPGYSQEKKSSGGKIRVWCNIKKADIKTTAEASSKQRAEQKAAALAIKQLMKSDAKK